MKLITSIILALLIVCSSSLATEKDNNQPPLTRKSFIRKMLETFKSKLELGNVEYDESRRGFLKNTGKTIVGAGVATNPGFLDALAKWAHRARLRKIARFRINSNLGESGLESYIQALKNEAGTDISPELKRALTKRIDAASETVKHINTLYEPNGETLKDLASQKDTRRNLKEVMNDPNFRRKNQRKIKKAQESLMSRSSDFVSLTLDILTARTLLEPILIKRMGFQISYTSISNNEFTLALDEYDLAIIYDYLEYIELLRNKFIELNKPLAGDAYIWLKNLEYEALLSLEAYEVSKQNIMGSCKALLN